jgi:hypothetical protein
LPETRVVAPAERRSARTPPPRQVVTRQPPAPTPPTQAQVVAQQNQAFDTARQSILAPIGATSYEVNHQAIEALPQGDNTPLDKALLQFPGVTQDSAASGELHVRNEHANIQYRINGIMLPDGVGAFGQILDTGIVGSLALLTGALPAQFGQRTAGVLDIRPGRTPSTTPAKSASMAVATEPSRPLSNMAARSGRPSISRPGAFSRTIWE